MTNITRVKRLLVDGDPVAGMSAWGPVKDDVVEGDPQERQHLVQNAPRPGGGVSRAGVWEATLEDYGCDEFCVLLEGSVTMIDDDGHEETFRAGNSFLIPKGFTGYWKQSEKKKKFFMTACYG